MTGSLEVRGLCCPYVRVPRHQYSDMYISNLYYVPTQYSRVYVWHTDCTGENSICSVLCISTDISIALLAVLDAGVYP